MDGVREHAQHTLPTPNESGVSQRTSQHGYGKPLEACTICLEPISERAVAVPCNHLSFDFLCLASWIQEKSTCPLCKADIIEIQYDFRSPEQWKTYRVPTQKGTQTVANRQYGRQVRYARREHEASSSLAVATNIDPALVRRRDIYKHRLYALRVGANAVSGYQDFNAREFAASAELQSKARMFLRRELRVFSFLDANQPGRTREYLMELISAILKTKDLKGADGEAEEMLWEFIGRANARQMLHELEAWLRCPYIRLAEWDEHVQYASQPGPLYGKV